MLPGYRGYCGAEDLYIFYPNGDKDKGGNKGFSGHSLDTVIIRGLLLGI